MGIEKQMHQEWSRFCASDKMHRDSIRRDMAVRAGQKRVMADRLEAVEAERLKMRGLDPKCDEAHQTTLRTIAALRAEAAVVDQYHKVMTKAEEVIS